MRPLQKRGLRSEALQNYGMAAGRVCGKLAWCLLRDAPPLAAAIHCKLFDAALDALYHTVELLLLWGMPSTDETAEAILRGVLWCCSQVILLLKAVVVAAAASTEHRQPKAAAEQACHFIKRWALEIEWLGVVCEVE